MTSADPASMACLQCKGPLPAERADYATPVCFACYPTDAEPKRNQPRRDADGYVSIYALIDPRSGKPMYVGKANHREARLKIHVRRQRAEKLPLCGPWLRELAAAGLQPTMALLERCRRDQWRDRERHHIRVFRDAGVRLLNVNAGGDGRD